MKWKASWRLLLQVGLIGFEREGRYFFGVCVLVFVGFVGESVTAGNRERGGHGRQVSCSYTREHQL